MRGRKGTPEGELATQRWRETMESRGGVKQHMQAIGSKGGKRTMKDGAKPKGFAANPQLAREAGKKSWDSRKK